MAEQIERTAEQKEKAERDFLTFDVKFNGLEELWELIKKSKLLVHTLKEAQELIDSLSGKKELEINDVAEKLADAVENVSVGESQGIGDQKEELDLPHEILKLIFDKSPEGISVGEIRDILKEIQSISEDIPMV